MTHDADTTLKPCPFCGEGVSLMEDPSHSTAWIISHDTSSCALSDYWDVWRSKDDAIEVWNTRNLAGEDKT